MTPSHSLLHEAIISTFLRAQRPPAVDELAARFGCDEPEVRGALRSLAEDHGVVLRPHGDAIWVAHPFSATPTPFVVRSATRAWWGTCAWCSLGLAHLAGEREPGLVTIETRLGALGPPATIRIEDGTLLDPDHVIHFPVAMRRAWDDILYACATMLLFGNEREVDRWCADRGIAKGDVRPLAQIWPFAAEWYGRHADRDWTKWSVREAAEIFARHRLDGPIWALPPADGRF